jgi:protein-L-isoaspartate O-methyltransferase
MDSITLHSSSMFMDLAQSLKWNPLTASPWIGISPDGSSATIKPAGAVESFLGQATVLGLREYSKTEVHSWVVRLEQVQGSPPANFLVGVAPVGMDLNHSIGQEGCGIGLDYYGYIYVDGRYFHVSNLACWQAVAKPCRGSTARHKGKAGPMFTFLDGRCEITLTLDLKEGTLRFSSGGHSIGTIANVKGPLHTALTLTSPHQTAVLLPGPIGKGDHTAEELVNILKAKGHLGHARTEAAMLLVPRSLFVPRDRHCEAFRWARGLGGWAQFCGGAGMRYARRGLAMRQRVGQELGNGGRCERAAVLLHASAAQAFAAHPISTKPFSLRHHFLLLHSRRAAQSTSSNPSSPPSPLCARRDQKVTMRMPDSSTLTLPPPSIVSMALEALDLAPGHAFLDVGCGTGYVTAVAAVMVGPCGTVHGIECISSRLEGARANLRRLRERLPASSHHLITAAAPVAAAAVGALEALSAAALRLSNVLIPECTDGVMYDAIYCDTSIGEEDLPAFLALLKPTGRAAVVINEELLLICRGGAGPHDFGRAVISKVSGDLGELEDPTPWEVQEAIARIKDREHRNGVEHAKVRRPGVCVGVCVCGCGCGCGCGGGRVFVCVCFWGAWGLGQVWGRGRPWYTRWRSSGSRGCGCG